jgi:hypothetical protein
MLVRWSTVPTLLLAALPFAASCAQHRIPATTAPVDEPRASWSIRAGEFRHEDEVCRSDVDRRCVIPASSNGQPVSVVVSIYLHPVADAETTYQGALIATFMTAGGHQYERQVDVKIEPGQRPTAVTTTGPITSTPGTYVLNLRLLAKVPMHTDPHPFDQAIPVEVVS